MMAEQDGVGECGPTAPTAYCCPSAAIVVHHGDDAAAAAVRQLDDAAAVGAGTVRWLDDGELRHEFDQSLHIARRELQVADAGVGRMHRVDREMRVAIDLLIGSHRAEALAAGIGRVRCDLEPRERHGRAPRKLPRACVAEPSHPTVQPPSKDTPHRFPSREAERCIP